MSFSRCCMQEIFSFQIYLLLSMASTPTFADPCIKASCHCPRNTLSMLSSDCVRRRSTTGAWCCRRSRQRQSPWQSVTGWCALRWRSSGECTVV